MKHIISPHIDDAVFSIGGILSDFRKRGETFGLQYVFTISDWTNPQSLTGKRYGKDPAVVSEVRKNEERHVSDALECQSSFLEFPDHPIRQSEAGLAENIVAVILQSCSDSNDEFFLPLGLTHPDHLIMRDVGVALLHNGRRVFFYEDLPYAADDREAYSERRDSIMKEGFRPNLQQIDIDKKLALASYYGSQVSAAWLESIRNFAYNAEDGKYYERYWWRDTYINEKEI